LRAKLFVHRRDKYLGEKIRDALTIPVAQLEGRTSARDCIAT
jgi:hypothetical protein